MGAFFMVHYDVGTMTDAPDTVGARLRAARKAKGLTQLEVAMKVRLARSMVTMLESGTRQPKPGELARIGAVLGVSEAELLGQNSPRA